MSVHWAFRADNRLVGSLVSIKAMDTSTALDGKALRG